MGFQGCSTPWELLALDVGLQSVMFEPKAETEVDN